MADALRASYLRATKKERAIILDELCSVTGYNRKSAIRLLNRIPRQPQRRGRRRAYGEDVANALKRVWDAADRIGSKRLARSMPEIVAVLIAEKELTVSEDVRLLLVDLSASTIDRLLKPFRS